MNFRHGRRTVILQLRNGRQLTFAPEPANITSFRATTGDRRSYAFVRGGSQ